MLAIFVRYAFHMIPLRPSLRSVPRAYVCPYSYQLVCVQYAIRFVFFNFVVVAAYISCASFETALFANTRLIVVCMGSECGVVFAHKPFAANRRFPFFV